MAARTSVLKDLITVLMDLSDAARKLGTSMTDVAREQRITNLIVRSQISADPAEKERLLSEARTRMDMPRRRSPHDPL